MTIINTGENLLAVVQAMYFMLILSSLCCLVRVFKTKRFLIHSIALSLEIIFNFVFLSFVINVNYRSKGKLTVSGVGGMVADAPLWIVLVMWLLMTAYVVLIFCIDEKYRRKTVTVSAIREGINHLPSGLCFSREDGRILLSNHKIRSLCHSITGEALQDANSFWRIITNGEMISGVSRIARDGDVTLMLNDGSVWTFSRKHITVDKKEITELSAADTSELYMLTRRLAAENEELEEMNRQLGRYCDNVDALVRSREQLDTKVRIHDSFGQALLSAKYLLSKENIGEKAEPIMKQWMQNISVFRREAEPRKDYDTWSQLTDAAEAAGIKIELSGELPSGSERELIISAAVEAMTNAVRHAQATVMNINIRKTDRGYITVFTNDGKAPDGEITLGGGLESLKKRIEYAGGAMTVEHSPKFEMTVTVPFKRSDIIL
ncbi:MAG: sensor histidine kinase [Eubacterium sp.]